MKSYSGWIELPNGDKIKFHLQANNEVEARKKATNGKPKGSKLHIKRKK